MDQGRRNLMRWAGAGLALGATASQTFAAPGRAQGTAGALRNGVVFISTNAVAANELRGYRLDGSHMLAPVGTEATDGAGTGAGLGSQGAVTLSQDGHYLFVVNAGSSSITTFRLRPGRAEIASVTPSGGTGPTSVAEHAGIVYVLNALGDGNITGFRNHGGQLSAIAGGVQPLSTVGLSAPAQVGFDRSGGRLIVTERMTNLIGSYRVRADGGIDAPVFTLSAGMTPFGFAFDPANHLIVSEAFGGAENASAMSSYGLGSGVPRVISASVATLQSAACWVVLTSDGRCAYTTNTGSGSISSYRVDRKGRLSLYQSVAAFTDGSGPLDVSITPDDRTLHVLNAAIGQVASYAIARDGSLSPIATADGLAAGAAGMAVI
jgi:6-phosphogluconolactonase